MLAALLRSEKPLLISKWKQRVLADPTIPRANDLSEPALCDHIPTLIDGLVDILDRCNGDEKQAEMLGRALGEKGPSKDHAQLRSESHYETSSAILEFLHLRMAVVEVAVEKRSQPTRWEWVLLHTTLDASVAVVASEMHRRLTEFQHNVLGIVSHDLRTPLSSIHMTANIMRRKQDVDEGDIERIERNTKRALHMVEDLLDFASARRKQLSINKREVDLRAVVENLVRDVVKDDLEFQVTGNVEGMFDPERMGQVVQNLLTNAVQHGTPGGPIQVNLYGEDGYVEFCVQNEGKCPTTPIFDAFAHGDASHGAGLGLFIANHIVEAHGGKLMYDCDAGKVRFIARLPRHHE